MGEASAAAVNAVGSVNIASTSDIEEQAALLRGWNQTYDQISSGPFHGSLLETSIGTVQLFREVTSNALHQTGALPKGLISIGVPLSLRGNATFCGTACDGSQLHVFSGFDGFEFHSPSGLDIAGIIFTEDELASVFSERDLEDLLPVLTTAHLRGAARTSVNHLRQLLLHVFDYMTEQHASGAKGAVTLEALSRDVLTSLADALAGDETPVSSTIPQVKRWNIVRRACDFANEAPQELVSVQSICVNLGVSRRTLQYCFQDTLGMAPATYLRALRLNGARRAIKVSGSVTEAATMWGFWHFGRFSREYKAMFGELPSETFRKAHGQKSASGLSCVGALPHLVRA